jgi:hypothetical protein
MKKPFAQEGPERAWRSVPARQRSVPSCRRARRIRFVKARNAVMTGILCPGAASSMRPWGPAPADSSGGLGRCTASLWPAIGRVRAVLRLDRDDRQVEVWLQGSMVRIVLRPFKGLDKIDRGARIFRRRIVGTQVPVINIRRWDRRTGCRWKPDIHSDHSEMARLQRLGDFDRVAARPCVLVLRSIGAFQKVMRYSGQPAHRPKLPGPETTGSRQSASAYVERT